MQTFLRFAAFVGALLLLGWGFSSSGRQTDVVWLALLAAAGALLGVAWWPRDTNRMPLFNRSLLRWATIILVFFTMVTVQLVRVQIVDSARISSRIAEAPDGEIVSNPRERLRALEMRRGSILDRDGRVLVESRRREDGTFERVWIEPTTAALIGYYSPQIYGASNIEANFDAYLSGLKGGNPAKEWLAGLLHEEQRGYDLRLSVDLDVQRLASELLAGRPGGVVLMDAGSGEVVAMVSEPGFDPNRLYANAGQQNDEEIQGIQAYWAELNTDPNAPLVFRPTQGLYNPGSTFKTVTGTALLDTGEAKLDTVYRDEGILEIEGRVIEELNRPDPTVVNYTLEEAYAYSLNIVFAQIGLQIGSETLWEYAGRFGFGEQIPFDIYTETTQLAGSRDALNNRALLADTGFGQGEILASPLQMAMVVTAVANGGAMPRAFLVEAVLDDQGAVLDRFEHGEWRRVMSKETAAAARELMLASVEFGYARDAAIEGATVGGKTGTAELGEGQEPHSWFTGFAEIGDRTYVVASVVERGGPGSQAALPIGRALLDALVQRGR